MAYRTLALGLTCLFATFVIASVDRYPVGCPAAADVNDSAKSIRDHSRMATAPLSNVSRRVFGAVAWVRTNRGAETDRGFRAIFNGQDLKGWDGNSDYWSVEAGAITGRTTADKPLPYNTFLIWRGKEVADFELKLEFRIEGTNGWANSGIQYRSHEMPDVGKWVLGGYQADIDLSKRYLGILYEERGRGILALRGQRVIIRPAENMLKRRRPFRVEVVGNLGDPDQLVADIDLSRWNTYRIVARGNRLVHIINGRKMVEVIDEDTAHRAMKGLIGLQLHRGRPMKVQFRNIYLKEY